MSHLVRSLLALALMLALGATGSAWLVIRPPEPEGPRPATVRVLDVGQGDVILIQSPEGRTALIDAGRSDDVVDLLVSLGVEHIDLVGVSHHDEDHFGGMDAVIEYFSPPSFLDTTIPDRGEKYPELLELVAERELATILLEPGGPSRRITLGTVVLTTLPQPPVDEEDNNNSIGLRIEHGDASILITGDSEEAARAWWLDPAHGVTELIADGDVVKLAHHGSVRYAAR